MPVQFREQIYDAEAQQALCEGPYEHGTASTETGFSSSLARSLKRARQDSVFKPPSPCVRLEPRCTGPHMSRAAPQARIAPERGIVRLLPCVAAVPRRSVPA